MNDTSLNKVFANRNNLERILNNLQDGIIAHDLERRIFYFNKMAETITGYAREEVIGRDCHDAFGGSFCGSRCSFCSDKPGFTKHVAYTVNITTKSGESRRVEMSATMMKDENNNDFGVLASFKDVSSIYSLKMKAKEVTAFGNIVGRNNKMLDVFQQIIDVAPYDSPVHINGETGTGKELVASAIHEESRRSGEPFVPINCGALPEGLIESELFGHVKGSFSGAVRDKKGRFEMAQGGTIFLDEVADLPKHVQVKLLRFLQHGALEKVGSEGAISIDARVISAANKDLKKEVLNKTFRDDLFYRLNVIPIHIPPLRERKNDIPLLSRHFLDQIEERYNKISISISDEAMSIMMDHNWPGNVREVDNVIQFAVIKCKNNIIMPADLPIELQQNPILKSKRGPSKKLTAETVRTAIERAGGNKAKAARSLGVG
ncbi:MAG: sigma 54-interacting transcriptional regulator, partial [Deltaproteobacteria bacterium]|nr:sigma 54-interacting transcriptional regulator [Deltaproteobacteria bacterium]